jgi:PIN domain nuclease of toxin-antitoxin system
VRLLLDTNALIWFLAAGFMEPEALVAITRAQKAGSLYLSPVTAWEAALALNKANPAKRPNLNGKDAAPWFRQACATTGAKIVRIGSRIALEAARVPLVSGNGDPGDCFIVATARVSKLAVVTRDRTMQRLSVSDPSYLRTIAC